ncbi:MAG: amidohydrolase family protein, partial [Solirubrobacteraceae bacterium]
SQLCALDALPSGFTAAHGVWLGAEEIRLLAGARATVAHNPASNLRLGNGIAPVRVMLDSALNVALGSDGSLRSDNQALFEAMRLAALVSRADPLSEPTRWLDAEEVFERATVGGAQAIGWDGQIGLIEPGRRADLVLLRADSMFLKPRNNLLNALAFAETGAAVDTVFVDGRMVVHSGQVTGVDEPRIRDRAQESVERLAHANRQLLADATELGPYVLSHCRALSAQDDPTVTA